MKKLRFFLTIIFAIGCLFALAGCAAPLSRPQDLTVDGDTLVLSWRAVPNARYYTVSVNGEQKDSRATKYSLSSLEAGEYSIRVKACSNGNDYRNSGWSDTFRFTREQEPGLTFTLINGRTEYEVSGLGTEKGDIVIPETFRGKPVTGIGNRAFAGKSLLTGVSLGDNITTIGSQAFYNCSYLVNINLPSTLTSIGEQAFQGCRALESDLTIPDGVTEIADDTFAYCRALKNVTIGKNVTSIGTSAFSDCVSLRSITIPDSVTSLGDYAFSMCKAVQNIALGNGLKTIGARAFYGCENINSVVLGGRIEEVGGYAFGACVSLYSAEVSDSVLSLGEGAFMGCSTLAEVSLGANLQRIGVNAFKDTQLWNEQESMVYADGWFLAPQKNTMLIYNVAAGTRGIAESAFYGCNSFIQITLPNSVEIIGDNAFKNCAELVKVVTGSGVKVIGASAFEGCAKLLYVRLCEYNVDTHTEGKSSVQEIKDRAFYGCARLVNINLPDTVETVGSRAFRNSGLYAAATGVVYAGNWVVDVNSASGKITVREGTKGIAAYAFQSALVSEIVLPDSVESIGRGAFSGCKALQDITLPKNLERLEDYTFYNCNYLMLDKLPETLKYIGRSAFYNCRLLGMKNYQSSSAEEMENATFTVPDSVESIGAYAFFGCGTLDENKDTGEKTLVGIRTLNLGSGVAQIGERAFSKFVSLKTVNFGGGVSEIPERAFYRCENLQTVNLNGVSKIGSRAFYGCIGLNRISLPDSVKEIAEYAFYLCDGLTSASLGGVTSVGNSAFGGCASLEELTLSANLVSLGKQAFRGAKIKSLTLTGSLAQMQMHVFYGCNDLTLYLESAADADGWNTRWNTSYRPVIYGVTLSQDKDYVVSFTKTAQSVQNAKGNTVHAPERAGYAFAGWATEEGGEAVYAANDLIDVPDGTVLFAVWTQN